MRSCCFHGSVSVAYWDLSIKSTGRSIVADPTRPEAHTRPNLRTREHTMPAPMGEAPKTPDPGPDPNPIRSYIRTRGLVPFAALSQWSVSIVWHLRGKFESRLFSPNAYHRLSSLILLRGIIVHDAPPRETRPASSHC